MSLIHIISKVYISALHLFPVASYNIITEELISTKEEFAEYERKDIKYQEDIKHLNSQTKKLEASVKKDAKTASECEERAENCLASLPTLEKRKRKAEKQVEEAEKNLELENGRIRKETEGLRATLEVRNILLSFSQNINVTRKFCM